MEVHGNPFHGSQWGPCPSTFLKIYSVQQKKLVWCMLTLVGGWGRVVLWPQEIYKVLLGCMQSFQRAPRKLLCKDCL